MDLRVCWELIGGGRGATEFAVTTRGYFPDGSSPRAAICSQGVEVLIYQGKPPGENPNG